MMDQHYPGMPLRGAVADHNCKGSKGINKMKAYSYSTGNVVGSSILSKGTLKLVCSSSADSGTLYVKGVV